MEVLSEHQKKIEELEADLDEKNRLNHLLSMKVNDSGILQDKMRELESLPIKVSNSSSHAGHSSEYLRDNIREMEIKINNLNEEL
jgi:hypothetical protein